MCTLSWRPSAAGFQLFFNRDERVTRGRALPPARRRAHGISYLAPQDKDAGGTWIAVAETGLALALLNFYQTERRVGRQSRGLLIPELIARPPAEVGAALAASPLDDFAPFTLVKAHEASFELARWDGQRLQPFQAATQPIVSSAVAEVEATRVRTDLFATFSADVAGNLAFHCSHLPMRGPLSPCMHREDAQTLSFTTIAVTTAHVEMAYADGPPCSAALGEALTLARPRSD